MASPLGSSRDKPWFHHAPTSLDVKWSSSNRDVSAIRDILTDQNHHVEVAEVICFYEDCDICERAADPSKARHGSTSPGRSHGEMFCGFSSCMATPFTSQVCSRGLSIEAPSKTRPMPNVGSRGSLSQMMKDVELEKQLGSPCSPPEKIIQETQGFSKRKVHHQKRRSYSTDFDRDEAWQRKRDLHQLDGQLMDGDKTHTTTSGRSASDCQDWSGQFAKPLSKTGSLTDEDLEELRGSIDLGFGFRNDESYDLKGTLPALELYYEINRRYVDARSRSSPISSALDGAAKLNRTSSGDSSSSSQNEPWRIASPGDHPSEVKTRLRHWAQAVACSIKQGCSAR